MLLLDRDQAFFLEAGEQAAHRLELQAEVAADLFARHAQDELARGVAPGTEALRQVEQEGREALQGKGLSTEESFLIGTRRVGSAAALAPEFAAENGGRGWRNFMRRLSWKYLNKVIHGLVLLYFATGCWLLWGVLRVSRVIAYRLQAPNPAPAFTQMFLGLMPYWYMPPLVALIYCGFAWMRKPDGRATWFGFFAIATAVLMLLALPTLIAAGLPVIDYLNREGKVWR